MIQGFKCKKTASLARDGSCHKTFSSFRVQAEKRLRVLSLATRIEDLMLLKSNHFEALSGNRSGQYSIMINEKWRICFRWSETGPYDVEIVDYH